MLFNSWSFLVFLGLVFPAYYTLPRFGFGFRAQIGLLFLASLVFYAFDKPILVFLLLFCITINAVLAHLIVVSSNRFHLGDHWVTIGVVANLALLSFFKYAGLVAESILYGNSFTPLTSALAEIPLPIGISFYVFQAISLLVDLHRKGIVGMESFQQEVKDGDRFTSFMKIAFYISFFPQLVAGPIVKAHDFINQIRVKRIGDVDWNIVISSLIVGYFLKMVVADNLKDVTYLLNTNLLETLGKVDLVFILYAYSFQIFADFAGYSLIAIGLGCLFGYRFPTNFNFPYISMSITEFWRRWHISLSSFLREYLYISLGGNRKGAFRTYINLFLVMFFGGLWHGAAWSYAIWGSAHGIFLAFERRFFIGRFQTYATSKIGRLSRLVYTFNVVSFLWLLFLMPDFSNVVRYLQSINSSEHWITSMQTIYTVVIYSMPVVVYHGFAFLRERTIFGWRGFEPAGHARSFILAVLVFLILTNSGTSGEFIYFQF